MAVFNVGFANKAISCTNKGNPDPETGCLACGDNAQSVYEQCRQNYYLKKDVQINQARFDRESILVTQNSNVATQTMQRESSSIVPESPPAVPYQFGLLPVFGLILAAFLLGYLIRKKS